MATLAVIAMILFIQIIFLVGVGLCISGVGDGLRERSVAWSEALKIMAVLVTLCGIGVVGALHFFNALSDGFDGFCQTTGPTIAVDSPNGQNVAYVIPRECGGATVGVDFTGKVNYHIIIREKAYPLKMDSDQRPIYRKDWLGLSIDEVVFAGDFGDLNWVSDNHLQIVEPDAGRLGYTFWRGVKISYKLKSVRKANVVK